MGKGKRPAIVSRSPLEEQLLNFARLIYVGTLSFPDCTVDLQTLDSEQEYGSRTVISSDTASALSAADERLIAALNYAVFNRLIRLKWAQEATFDVFFVPADVCSELSMPSL